MTAVATRRKNYPAGAVVLTYRPRGAAKAVFSHRDAEVALVGPAGTGKTRAALEKLHAACLKHAGIRALMVRKTRKSLSESAMVTYETKVLHDLDGVKWQPSAQRYVYPNGSIIAVGGMDKPQKVLSSEWDMIYCPQAEELTEYDWEMLGMRLRNGKMPYQQLLADVNPDAPTHWLRLRMDAGRTLELVSRHEDNPLLYDDNGAITGEGIRYIGLLEALSGVRKQRYRWGMWSSAEGMIYEDVWNRAVNVLPRQAISKKPDTLYGDCGIDRSWPRYLSIDFGYTHPFVCRWYALDPDGRAYMYREIYMTHRIVADHAADILKYSQWGKPLGDPLPQAIFCDHDAEGRATLESVLGLHTTAANKAVKEGIQYVADRMRPAGDGRPRLFYLEESLVQRDPLRVEKKRPTCGLEEIESYIWDERREAPIKEDDDAMDTDRYLCASLDSRSGVAGVTDFKFF